MAHGVKGLTKIHREHPHCLALGIIKKLADLILDKQKSISAAPSFSVRELTIQQLFFYRPLRMNLIHCFLQGSCNDRGYVDPREVPSLHWNINFWQWVDICPFPRSRPLMRSERQIPEPCNNWSEDIRLVFPHPIRNLIRTSRSLL